MLTGSLAPNGAVIKRSAASTALEKHTGPAVVFNDIDDLANRPIDFFDHIAIQTAFGFAAKLVAHVQGDVQRLPGGNRHGGRQVRGETVESGAAEVEGLGRGEGIREMQGVLRLAAAVKLVLT